MGDFMKKAMEAYEQQQVFGKLINTAKKMAGGDSRYNTPKEPPKASEEAIDKAIEETEIYKQAKERILKFQRGQVGYGLDKYPETLNADTWTEIETQHHIIEESVDKLHYEVMRLIQLERKAEKELEKLKKAWDDNLSNLTVGKVDASTITSDYGSKSLDTHHRSDVDLGQFAQYVHDLKKLGLKPIDTKQKEKNNKLKTLYDKQITFATMEEAKKAEEKVPVEHSQMHGYSMKDAEETDKVWKAMNAVHDNFMPGADTDGDYGDIRDDKIDALAYSFGHLGAFSNSGKTINDIRKDNGLEPIETVGVRLSSEEIQEIGKAVAQYLKKEADRHA